MDIKTIIEKAKKALSDSTGLQNPRGVGIKKTGKEWIVRAEITEKASIPEAMDVLGMYEIRLNEKGDLLSYERKGLRKRGDTQPETIIE